MATIWITYAWADNKDGDVDFIAQELERAGLKVKLDRWNLTAGKRLWEQIETFIQSTDQSDAWLMVATHNSLSSEPCKEEFAYALNRALGARGHAFPVIGLFPGPADDSLIPAAIKTRLYVSITDPDWKERIVAAAEGRTHAATRVAVDPFYLKVHAGLPGDRPFAIEVRPRAGVWAPFIAGILNGEKEAVDPFRIRGPRDHPTNTGMMTNAGEGTTPDGRHWLMVANDECTPTQSYYVWCRKLPSLLIFGQNGGTIGVSQFALELAATR
jgi:hypothetical protein